MKACHQANAFMQALLDLTVIAFFFLLRPGEHCYDKQNDHPLCLQDISFQSPNATSNAATITNKELALATTVHLEFTGQKSGNKGEVITHGNTHKELVTPLKAL